MTRREFWTIAAAVALAAGLAGPNVLPTPAGIGGSASSTFPSPGSGLPGRLPNDHLQHVITVMMENHDYDSYFGTYCETVGPYCSNTGNGVPQDACIPYYPSVPAYGCVTPYNLTPSQFLIGDMEHDWWTGGIARDGGAMDGFFQAEATTLTFGHYNQTTIPVYWDMAEEYASGDNFWGANLSYSLPNHWYLVAGATPPIAYDNYVGFSGLEPSYLNEANNTSSVEDLLVRSNVSWEYYDLPLESYSAAITGSGLWGTAYDYWNPMIARAESYTAPFASHFGARANILTDLKDGDLPNVSWVIPDPSYSDHPGYNNSYGEGWVAQLVNAVESSSYWNSTAIFVSWDDFGGWYDQVAPPTVLDDMLSFRAPILVISPYAKENYISHGFTDFMSLLRFVEWQFGLGCLTPLDCLAPLPLDYFDFNQNPRAPILFQTSWKTASYPMPLQTDGPLNAGCLACRQAGGPGWQTTPMPLLPQFDYT